ncbi:MAG: hypothetical protein ACR2RB_22040 [Gammaproteobacteria bacterium]
MRSPATISTMLLALMILSSLGTNAIAQQPEVGARIAALEMERVQRKPNEIAQRALATAELMLGRKVSSVGVDTAIASRTSADWSSVFADAPQLLVRYLPEHDELRVINLELTSSIDSAESIGEQEAVNLARNYLSDLERRGVLDRMQFDLSRPQVGYHRVAAGEIGGQKKYDRITEYRITLRHLINGIETANAGVRLSVHASGRLAGVRLGGVNVKSVMTDGFETPTGQGKVLTRSVSTGEIAQRFFKSLPDNATADVAWSRVMYVMPEDTNKAVVEPLHVYSYSEIHEVEGQLVPSRRKVVGFSITDASAPPVDFTPPTRQHEDEPPRQQ